MENPRGRVIQIETSRSSLLAEVEVNDAPSCARCAAGKGCGAGLLAGNKRRRVQALVANGVEIRTGDEVRIELAPRNLLRASWLVYGLPLTGAVTVAGGAYLLQLGDFAAAFAAIVGLAAGMLVARYRLRETDCLREFTPTIVERLPAAH
ncbi:MAG: SoxR reducing system RseC family protein [Gammaproteobacteria bacterium]|nr:SoxR reducing system RseC family protein [Gammaproteobacteria bacterium]